jgi:catalase
LLNRVKPGIKTRKIALLAAPGSDGAAIRKLQQALKGEGATPMLIAPTLAAIDGMAPDATIAGLPSIMFDAVIVVGGEAGAKTLAQSGDARHFVLEAFKHLKALAAIGAGREVLAAAHLPDHADGVVSGDDRQAADVLKNFVKVAEQHRVWSRAAQAETVPA